MWRMCGREHPMEQDFVSFLGCSLRNLQSVTSTISLNGKRPPLCRPLKIGTDSGRSFVNTSTKYHNMPSKRLRLRSRSLLHDITGTHAGVDPPNAKSSSFFREPLGRFARNCSARALSHDSITESSRALQRCFGSGGYG